MTKPYVQSFADKFLAWIELLNEYLANPKSPGYDESLKTLAGFRLDPSLLDIINSCVREIGFSLQTEGDDVERDRFKEIVKQEVDAIVTSLRKVNLETGEGAHVEESGKTDVIGMARKLQATAPDKAPMFSEYFICVYDAITLLSRGLKVPPSTDLQR